MTTTTEIRWLWNKDEQCWRAQLPIPIEEAEFVAVYALIDAKKSKCSLFLYDDRNQFYGALVQGTTEQCSDYFQRWYSDKLKKMERVQ